VKKIAILDCGPSLIEVSNEFGYAPEWIMALCAQSNAEFSWIRSYEGETIDENAANGFIITGSPLSVYEEAEWMLESEAIISNAHEKRLPILGICFGHQLIAKALGGTVELNPSGWELGSYPVELTMAGIESPLFTGIPNPFYAHESHQDAVTMLPTSAIELAKNTKGNQAFHVGETTFGVQFHPEFSHAVIKKYVEVRSQKGVTVDGPSVPASTHSHLILHNFIQSIN
jgi:GMP synthase (glutamine-hydrolysing)